MNNSCKECKFGYDTKPGGQRPSPGTVWCAHRGTQMALNRQMPCFIAIKGRKTRHCFECKRARITKPTGRSLQLGHVWCEKKHFEINKQRCMDCFEQP